MTTTKTPADVEPKRGSPAAQPLPAPRRVEPLPNLPAASGKTLEELSRETPVLLVFLRHSGCGFCREALGDLKRQAADIHAAGVRLVVVHMSPAADFTPLLEAYGLGDVEHISDPQKRLFSAFGLARGTLWQNLKPWVIWRGFQAVILERHGCGLVVGDPFQMPGVFVYYQGLVLAEQPFADVAQRPNYAALAREGAARLA